MLFRSLDGDLIKPSNFSGTSRVYYTGNWVQDIHDNYTDKQAETIFKKVEKLKPQLDFFQKKLEPFTDSEGKVWVVAFSKSIIFLLQI